MSKKIAIIGGGGFAKEIIEVAKMNGYEIYGIFAQESSLDDYRYCGYLDELKYLKDEFDGVHIAIGVANEKGVENRRTVIEFLKENGIDQISLVSPLATIAEDVKIGEGVYVGHKVLISLGTTIADSVLFNHSSVIGHDCKIEENISIAPLVFLGGGVVVEQDVMIGVRSTIRQGVNIGEKSTIGMCSTIIKNIKSNSITLPTPTKSYKK